jgi:hypothetical protein
MIPGLVRFVTKGISDEVAKRWCVDNFASHFERRNDGTIVFKTRELKPTNQKWIWGCEMYCEGLMSDSPEGGGYTWARLDMLPTGKRNFYETKLEYLNSIKADSSCDQNCQTQRILKLLSNISLVLLPVTLPVGFFAGPLAAAGAIAASVARAITVADFAILAADVGVITADVVITNVINWKEVLAADRFATFKDVRAVVNNFDTVLPDWKIYYPWYKSRGNFDGSILPECCCENENERWTGEKTQYGIKKWEEFVAWPKAPYNYSNTFLDYATSKSITKDGWLRDVSAGKEFQKDCQWYMDRAGAEECKSTGCSTQVTQGGS